MKIRLIFIGIAFMTLAQNLSAQGDLLVSPVRVIFEGNKQKEDISLVNIGNDTAVYSVSFVQYDMAENGNFLLVDQPREGQKYADQYLRIFPRRVILAPHASQVVRLQFRRAPGMEDGEYRSHLYFRAEKGNKTSAAGFSDKQKLMSVEITPIFGISIPIIIRVGNVNASSSLTDINLVEKSDTTAGLNITLNRSGNMSLYGDIVVDYVADNGKMVEIGNVRGVAVYTCANKRLFTVRLKNPAGLDLKSGKIKVLFTSPKDTRHEVYAQKELDL